MTVETKRPAPPPINPRGGSASQYRELPEGTWRFVIGEPKIRQMWSDRYQKWSTLCDFPLRLTDAEKRRLEEEHGRPPDGILQSWGPAFGGYSCSFTMNPASSGKESAFVTFVAAAFGAKNAKAFRDWVASGGAPTLTAEDNDGQIAELNEWLRWMDGCEIYGTILHHSGDKGILARFGGPLAVGSPPGPPEPEYQATMKAKLRAFMTGETLAGPPMSAEEGVALGAEVAAKYTPQGEPVEPADAQHDPLTCRCDDCSEKLRARAAEMFGSGSAA